MTFWKVVLAIGGLLGLYHLLSEALGKPKVDVSKLLNILAATMLERKLASAHLDHITIADFHIDAGQVQSKNTSDEDEEVHVPTMSDLLG